MISRRLPARRAALWLLIALLLGSACSPFTDSSSDSENPAPTALPTPASDTLQVTGTTPSGERLRVVLPSITVERGDPDAEVQLFAILIDPAGTYSYLLYPANQSGIATGEFDLSQHPLQLGIVEETETVTLWVLALHHADYRVVERYGLDALATSLARGFRDWLNAGDPDADPLAAVVSGSGGTLYEWFGEVDVVGQGLARASRDDWERDLASLHSDDGRLSAVYDVDHLAAEESPATETPKETPAPAGTPEAEASGSADYALTLDETFDDPAAARGWYQGSDTTFANEVTDGAYQIRLLDISGRPYAMSWGSLSGARFGTASVEAEIGVQEDDVTDARYGLWFPYQDDYNFLYFGLSNQGEYRVAVVENNRTARIIQDWTEHEAILTGTATNLLTIDIQPDGHYALSVNGTPLLSFEDSTFTDGSLAFFCYARSVPATCRLEALRVWEPAP